MLPEINGTVEVTREMKAKAANEVVAKKNDGFGKTRTTLQSLSEDDVEALYETGALGEVVFGEWCERHGLEVEWKDRGHDFDFTVNGVDIDVKATAAGLRQIEISKTQVERKDETPDYWVKVDVSGPRAKIIGFISDDDYRRPKNEVDSVYGNGPGWRVYTRDYVDDPAYLLDILKTAKVETKYSVNDS